MKGRIYGGRVLVSLIPGDGIGRELTGAVQRIFTAANVPVDWEVIDRSPSDSECKGDASQDDCKRLLDRMCESVRRNQVALKGPFHTALPQHIQSMRKKGDQSNPAAIADVTSLNVAFRQNLDLFANVVHIKALPGVPSPRIPAGSSVDIALIRENLQGEYSGLEHEPIPGELVESIKVVTRRETDRILRYAFDYVLRNRSVPREDGQTRRLTCVHKANIQKLSDGLFLGRFRELAATEYAQALAEANIRCDDVIVDAASMNLVRNPGAFDTVVTSNLYGAVLGNIGAGLVGGPGLVPGFNMGSEYASFEVGTRHVGLDIAGKNSANPISMLLASCLMLKHIGLGEHAARINSAMQEALQDAAQLECGDPKHSSCRYGTHDIVGGQLSTTQFIERLISLLK